MCYLHCKNIKNVHKQLSGWMDQWDGAQQEEQEIAGPGSVFTTSGSIICISIANLTPQSHELSGNLSGKQKKLLRYSIVQEVLGGLFSLINTGTRAENLSRHYRIFSPQSVFLFFFFCYEQRQRLDIY